ncbi:uncharacterized protein ISCGN_019458 [Ixodes scapularis]
MLGENLGGIPGVDLVNKFKNAKDTYQKHKNKVTCSMKSGAGAAQVGKITWPHFMEMMEIVEPVSPNPISGTTTTSSGATSSGATSSGATSSSASTSGATSSGGHLGCGRNTRHDDSEMESPADSILPNLAEQDGPVQQEEPRDQQQLINKARPHSSGSSMQDPVGTCVNLLEEIRERRARKAGGPEDPVHHFCASLAGRIRTLHETKQIEIMHDIEDLIYKAQREHFYGPDY